MHALQGARESAFDHRKLAEALARATGKEVAPERLPIDNLAFSDAARMFRFDAASKRWECDLLTYELREAGYWMRRHASSLVHAIGASPASSAGTGRTSPLSTVSSAGF